MLKHTTFAKTSPLKKLLAMSVLLLAVQTIYAQDDPTYNIKFVKAIWVAGSIRVDPWSNSLADSNIIAVFELTPTDMKDWSPVFSEKLAYSFDDKKEIKALLLHQKTISVVFYGKNVKEKDQRIYEMVKDDIANYKGDEMLFIAFNFRNPCFRKPNKMSMTYGMWQKNNTDVRIEKKYDFKVE